MKTRKSPSQKRAKETVEAILSAAAQVLENAGFSETSTNKIAERAGVSIGSLYQYFPNKETLVSSLCERHFTKSNRRMEEVIESLKDAPLEQAVEDSIRFLLKMILENQRFFKIFSRLVPKLNLIPFMLNARKEMGKRLTALFERRQKEIRPENPKLASFVLLNAVLGVIQVFLMMDEEDLDNIPIEELEKELTELAKRFMTL